MTESQAGAGNDVSPRVRKALEELAAALAEEGDDVVGFGLDQPLALSIGFQRQRTPMPGAPILGSHACLGYCFSEGGCGVEFIW